MTKPIPLYIDDVLREWDTIAFIAYDGYEQTGPGVVAIMPAGNSSVLLYGERDFFVKQGNHTVLGMIDDYDPDQEFLALFDTDDGNTRTLRVRTAEGGRQPKRVWLFEMLRRVNDDPESLPEEIPRWFRDILEKIDKRTSNNRQG